jgi:hypothetical protein
MMLLLDGIGIAGTSGSVAMPAKPKTSAKRKANARDNKLYQKWDNDPDPKARDYMRDFCYRRRHLACINHDFCTRPINVRYAGRADYLRTTYDFRA